MSSRCNRIERCCGEIDAIGEAETNVVFGTLELREIRFSMGEEPRKVGPWEGQECHDESGKAFGSDKQREIATLRCG